MTGDNWPKTRRADPLMTMTGRVGRNGTVFYRGWGPRCVWESMREFSITRVELSRGRPAYRRYGLTSKRPDSVVRVIDSVTCQFT